MMSCSAVGPERRRRRILTFGLLLALASPALSALVPYRVADLRDGSGALVTSEIHELVAVGRRGLFFLDQRDVLGEEPWITDGTDDGTYLLADICPVPCSRRPELVATGPDVAFFAATPTGRPADRQIWRTDGTLAGTVQVTSFGPGEGFGVASRAEGYWAPALRQLYVRAGVSGVGGELFVAGNARSSFRLVADLVPGPESSAPHSFFEHRSQVYFTAQDAAHGRELWVTDGTPGGTRRVADLLPGEGSSEPAFFAAAGERLVFLAEHRTRGRGLWATDGTAAGTRFLAELVPGQGDPVNVGTASLGDRVIVKFRLGDGGGELWVTDGTAAGTRRLAAFSALGPFPALEHDGGMVTLGGRAFFPADAGVRGMELWVTDGTAAGTRRLTDLCPGSCSSFFARRGVTDRFVYTPAFQAGESLGVWVSDGVEGFRLQGLCDRPCAEGFVGAWSLPDAELFASRFAGRFELYRWDVGTRDTRRIAVLGDRDAFFELRGVKAGAQLLMTLSSEGGRAGIWRSDGTAGGTRRVRADLTRSVAGSFPRGLMALDPPPGGRLMFFANGGVGRSGLWRTDGTAASTELLAPVFGGHSDGPEAPDGTVSDGERAYFYRPVFDGPQELWVTDGTGAGTRRAATLELASRVAPRFHPERPWQQTVIPMALARGRVFILDPFGLWSSDGTQGGTVQLESCPLPEFGPPEDRPLLLAVAGAPERVFYAGCDRRSVWATDGTPGGTVELVGFPESNPGAGISRLVPLRDGAAFVVFGIGEAEIWLTDGTAAGTRRIERGERPPFEGIHWIAPLGEELLVAPTLSPFAEESRGLWKTDGTAAGTVPVAEVRAQRVPTGPAEMPLPAGGRVFFIGNDGRTGDELWVSDGTEAGTVLLRDVYPGRDGSDPRHLTDVGGFVLFAARDGATGFEPWVSDGTPAGTRRVADLAPGPASSHPSGFTRVGSRVYFAADGAGAGPELWALCPGTRPVLRVDEAEVSPGDAVARFAVRLSTPFCGGVSARFTTGDGTARAGRDYRPVAGTLDLAPGEVEAVVTVELLDGAEGSFFLHLSEARNALLVKATGGAVVAPEDDGGVSGGPGDAAGVVVLTEAEVACSAHRLEGLLGRIRLASRPGNASGLGLTFSASGDFLGSAWVRSGTADPERLLAFSINPEEMTLLRNPERPQLASVSATRNNAASDLVDPDDPGRLELTLNPTLDGRPSDAALLRLDDLRSPHGLPASSRPGRGLGPLVEACHERLTPEDAHALQVLARTVRAESPGTPVHEIALYRDRAPDRFRIDVYPEGSGGADLGRLSARLAITRRTDGALEAGSLELLGPCTAGVREGCTDAAVPTALEIAPPVGLDEAPGHGARWIGTSGVRWPTADRNRTSVDWAELLAGTSWRRPLAAPDRAGSGAEAAGEAGVLSAAEVACDAARLEGLLGRVRVSSAVGEETGLSLTFTGSGDFAGLAYTVEAGSRPERHLVVSTNPEETTLLRNPERLQLASFSATRNALNSDLVEGAAGLRIVLDPTQEGASPAPEALLVVDDRAGPEGRSTAARPGRGLGSAVVPCHGPFGRREAHLFQVLAKLARGFADGGRATELAILRGEEPATYRIDVHPVSPDGEPGGRLAAELAVTYRPDGSLDEGVVRVLGRCAGGAPGPCTDAPGLVGLDLVRPVFSGELHGEAPYRVFTLGVEGDGQPEARIDWQALLAGTTWGGPLP